MGRPHRKKRGSVFSSKLFEKFAGDSLSDADLLAEMELNPKQRDMSIEDVVIKSTRITFQFSACVLFMVLYQLIKLGSAHPNCITKGCWFMSMCGHLIYQVNKHWPIPFFDMTPTTFIKIFLPPDRLTVTVFYVLTSFALAPVLHGLTATISTDTIHAVSAGLIFTHLLTNDYGVAGFLVSKTISMNAGIIAAICLSSRLANHDHSIALVTLATLTFILFPMFSTIIWDSPICLALIVVIVSYSCYTISVQFFLIYIGVVCFVTVLLPLVFVASQRFKYNLYGPWDEAVVDKTEK